MYAANPLPWHGRPPLPKYLLLEVCFFFNVGPPSYKLASSPKQVETKLYCLLILIAVSPLSLGSAVLHLPKRLTHSSRYFFI